MTSIPISTEVPAHVQVYLGRYIQVAVPESPLKTGSIQVSSLSNEKWTKPESEEAFDLLQRIVQVWKQKGIESYLIYAKEPNAKDTYEIVPYQDEWSFLQQLGVLKNTLFNGSSLSLEERQHTAKEFEDLNKVIPQPHLPSESKDVFDDPEVIQKQLVYEGIHLYILYNYAPIADLHFLIIPKLHRDDFSQLTKEEYVELIELKQKLTHFYKDHTAYIFDKNGKPAGQTVPHFHEHIVFTVAKADEIMGRLQMGWNMLKGGSSPLPPDELHKRVTKFKEQLR